LVSCYAHLLFVLEVLIVTDRLLLSMCNIDGTVYRVRRWMNEQLELPGELSAALPALIR